MPSTTRTRLAALGALPAAAALLGCAVSSCGGAGAASAVSQGPARLQPAKVPTDLGRRAFAHAKKIVAMGERYPGSEGWRRQIEYIQSELRKLELKPKTDEWTNEEFSIPLVNISARLPGSSPDRIMIGCHHDTKHTHGHGGAEQNFEFVGANDGASGVGLSLALAEYWSKQARESGRKQIPTIEFVFFDGEEARCFDWDREQALFGSKRYVAKYRDSQSKSRIRALVLLDMVGAKELSIDDDTHSDRALHAIFRNAAEVTGHAKHFFRESMAIDDDHLPFVQADIPAIDLIDFIDNPQWHTPNDTLEHMSAESLHKVGQVVATALPAIVSRYFPVQDR